MLKNQSGPQSERIRKKLIELFQTYDLKITSYIKLVQADFLDVTLNLKSGKYWPYRKPNNQPLYINERSNHPPAITKQLPSMLANRLSRLSSNENQFAKAAPDYMNTMHQSGHSTDEIRYEPNHTKKTRSRKRNIIWFNPPYSEHVQTNICREFLRLLSKHFLPHHKLHKIINKNNVKISYSCMANMGAVIKKHNAKLLSSEPTASNNNQTLPCNCRNKPSSPLGGKCRDKSIIYKIQSHHQYLGRKERLHRSQQHRI